ncbi:unnamed protein product [Closterium sp. NIES-53]
MASTPALNRGNSSAPSSDTDRNAQEMTGDRHNKRRAEEGSPAPTAVDVLLGGLEVNKNPSPPQQQHPSVPVAHVAPEARVAQVATAAPATPVTQHTPDAEHTPAPVAGPSRQRQRRRTATSSDATTPTLTNALTPDQVAALLSLLQQQPASVTATEIAQPAASASAKKENAKGEKGARGTTANRHDKEAPASIPPAPAADNDTDGFDDDDGVIVTIGLNVHKTTDGVHRRISAERLQTLIAFCSQLQMTCYKMDLERLDVAYNKQF